MTETTFTVSEFTNLDSGHNLIDAVQTYLEQEEALNSIILDGLRNWRSGNNPKTRFFVVQNGEEISLIASLTLGFRNLLSQSSESTQDIPRLVDHLLENDVPVPGVMAETGQAHIFANTWANRTGCNITTGMKQRMLVCRAILPQPESPGPARLATDEDWPTLSRWVGDFGQESDHVTPDRLETYVEGIRRHLAEPAGIMIQTLTDSTPVSMAGFKAPTKHGWRIGPVYTPPEHRKRGYGQAVTTAATRTLMEDGAEFVCLYTDAANPTSNHIYEEIGYRWIADIDNLIFESPPDGSSTEKE